MFYKQSDSVYQCIDPSVNPFYETRVVHRIDAYSFGAYSSPVIHTEMFAW